jgi:beta-glucosidase-like glycosyl hydrolase
VLAAFAIAASLLVLSPQQKAELLVVTTVRPGVFAGAARITFADQEGGLVRAVVGAPTEPASSYRTVEAAFANGRATARALARAGVDVDFALLRRLGFNGIAVTDSLSIVRSAPVERWAPQAIRAGADIVLFTSPAHARRAVRALLPLARRGELDERVRRVLRFRAAIR